MLQNCILEKTKELACIEIIFYGNQVRSDAKVTTESTWLLFADINTHIYARSCVCAHECHKIT